MKKLQNNFTTPEQSKKLLELGVPAWTADLRYRICKVNDSILGNPYLTKGKKYTGSHFNSSLPCWSVGRLMEVYDTCLPDNGDWPNYFKYGNLLEYAIDCIDVAIEKELIDFSKLEE